MESVQKNAPQWLKPSPFYWRYRHDFSRALTQLFASGEFFRKL
jgi:hypothetical protein